MWYPTPCSISGVLLVDVFYHPAGGFMGLCPGQGYGGLEVRGLKGLGNPVLPRSCLLQTQNR